MIRDNLTRLRYQQHRQMESRRTRPAFSCAQDRKVYKGQRWTGPELGFVTCWRHRDDGSRCGGAECKGGKTDATD